VGCYSIEVIKKPEERAAAEAVFAVRGICWIDRDFSPVTGFKAGDGLDQRLAADSHYRGTNGRPVVVFFTALDTKLSTPKARASQRLSKDIGNALFDPIAHQRACDYAQFADMVRVDVGAVKGTEDVISGETAPVVAFYDAAGKFQGSLAGKKANEQVFCKILTGVFAAQNVSIKEKLQELNRLANQIGPLAKKKYRTNDVLKRKQSQVRGATNGTIAKQVADLKAEIKAIDEEIAAIEAAVEALRFSLSEAPAAP